MNWLWGSLGSHPLWLHCAASPRPPHGQLCFFLSVLPKQGIKGWWNSAPSAGKLEISLIRHKWSHCHWPCECHARLWRSWCGKGRTLPSSLCSDTKQQESSFSSKLVHIDTTKWNSFSGYSPHLWTTAHSFSCIHLMTPDFASSLLLGCSYSAPSSWVTHSYCSKSCWGWGSKKSPQSTLHHQSKLH